jgi:hypothetical protein
VQAGAAHVKEKGAFALRRDGGAYADHSHIDLASVWRDMIEGRFHGAAYKATIERAGG